MDVLLNSILMVPVLVLSSQDSSVYSLSLERGHHRQALGIKLFPMQMKVKIKNYLSNLK
jgi:hypothetical protein